MPRWGHLYKPSAARKLVQVDHVFQRSWTCHPGHSHLEKHGGRSHGDPLGVISQVSRRAVGVQSMMRVQLQGQTANSTTMSEDSDSDSSEAPRVHLNPRRLHAERRLRAAWHYIRLLANQRQGGSREGEPDNRGEDWHSAPWRWSAGHLNLVASFWSWHLFLELTNQRAPSGRQWVKARLSWSTAL